MQNETVFLTKEEEINQEIIDFKCSLKWSNGEGCGIRTVIQWIKKSNLYLSIFNEARFAGRTEVVEFFLFVWKFWESYMKW